ncbi:MAG TPA: hypothetical protein VN150_02245 [Ochrobactrum sp.]|nr:hypothetical protein [Ochrobactrum sp.]
MHIMVRDKRNGVVEWIPLEQVAELMGIAVDEIDAALEEFGECEGGNYIALQPE